MGMPAEIGTVEEREAAWLNMYGDGLPALSTAQNGPFGIIQAFWPANRFATQKPGIYVLVRSIGVQHPTAQRYRPQYLCTLKLVWPVRASTTNLAETEQAAFAAARALLAQRISGFVGDKTHGGRFLSVAEVPEEMPLAIDVDDPEVTIQENKELRAVASYHIDDLEYNG